MITPELITQNARITDPKNMVKQFKTREAFIEWVNEGTDEDLACTIKEFTKAELFEHVAIVLDVLKSRQ